jgi:hypothetical protein
VAEGVVNEVAMCTSNSGSAVGGAETQLAEIRELMLRVGARGEWLTLGEVAAMTEFAEASISAQLRHLRKPSFGSYSVEKRRRRGSGDEAEKFWRGGTWEYRVSRPVRVREAECDIADDIGGARVAGETFPDAGAMPAPAPGLERYASVPTGGSDAEARD